ncbi:MAG TPA: hypothetical protein VG347_04135 [Verrucomicrobiae bacterium]|nr:hypothetical protein [Verrucomicrobiae bacterium]
MTPLFDEALPILEFSDAAFRRPEVNHDRPRKKTHLRKLTLSLTVLIFCALQSFAQDFGYDTTRSVITIIDANGKSKRIVLDSNQRFGAPSWSGDGTYLVLNSGGKLWRVSVDGKEKPKPISTGTGGVDIDHGVSPDGKTLAVTSGALFAVPIDGGEPRQLTPQSPSYFQSWSPDGKTLVYTANRGRGSEIFSIDFAGGEERRLVPSLKTSDAASYSCDGAWIYFCSQDSGNSELWRVAARGDSSKPELVLADERANWSPRPSPDGKWLFYLSYPPKTRSHPADRDVILRRIPLPGAKVEPAKVVDIARFTGGHGSIGKRPWSPDGHSFAYVSYEPPPPSVRIVMFTPSDLEVPDGANQRLTKIANSAERFLFAGMKQWGYPAMATNIFRREKNGSVEVLRVKGEFPLSSGKYWNPGYADYVIDRASRQYEITGDGHIWWIFIYLGDRPTRFGDWRGDGFSRGGGWAMVNYDTIPGEIRPDLGLDEGFNAQYFLKGSIHELGHAFGLPHAGPDIPLNLGNSLMGPNMDVYAKKEYPHPDHVYLSEASAAMLWKHPVFSGTDRDRVIQPSVKLSDYHARYSQTDDVITLTGKLISDQPAHTVVVTEDPGQHEDDHWFRSHAARLARDGTFTVKFDHPPKSDVHYHIRFCFQNGFTTGDGTDTGSIQKSQIYKDGNFEFDE